MAGEICAEKAEIINLIKFPYAILKCDILKEKIAFVSCSNTVANVLYILTDDGEIFLLQYTNPYQDGDQWIGV